MTDPSPIDAFERRLDAWGVDLARWPEDAAEDAAALLGRSRQARARHASAKRFQALLAEAARADAPNGFAFRVVGEVAARRADRWSWLSGSPGRAGFAGVSFCVAALAIGVALGSVATPGQGGATSLDLGAAVELALADGDL